MRLHKANSGHLYLAGYALARSDREEMDRIQVGRNPVDVLTAALDETTMAISKESHVLAVGGHHGSIIWFVHTEHAEVLRPSEKLNLFKILKGHLRTIKAQARRENPVDMLHFTNVVSSANTKHLRLLKALGATFSGVRSIHNGHEFRHFFF